MRMSLRKVIFILVIVILTVLAGFIIIKGVNIGNFEILGITGIIQKNKDIDDKNKKLATDASTTYVTKVATLEQTAKSLQNKKDEYTNEAVLVGEAGNGYISTTEKYEIEYLWTRLGNYAKDENVDIKIDVTNSTMSGKFDLNFTVIGSYVGITDFIYDIENDSKLGFKIEDFVMQSLDDKVQATFSCKQININIENIENKETNTNEEETKNNTNSMNSTNSASNTTGTKNATKSTNTTKSTNSTNITSLMNDID